MVQPQESTSETSATTIEGRGLVRLPGLIPGAIDALERNLTCGEPDIEVHTADIVLRAVRELGSAYSFTGHVSNRTDLTLTLSSKDANGSWETEPPDTVGAGGTGDWKTTYDGFNHEGTVVYAADGTDGAFTVEWQIPLFGNNTISASTTISGTSARHEGGRGWHAEVWYYLETA